MVTGARADAGSRRALIAGIALTVAVLVAGLFLAKWMPYVAKATAAARTHHWSGSDILRVGGVHAGDAPSWHAATVFFHAYVTAIWPALLTALLVSACVQTFVPRTWLPRLMNHRGTVTTALAGGAAAMPSMMCACCAAPVTVTLRRSGVDRSAAVAYWLGNPLLNPAVLVFLVFVAPWQWSLVRLVIGAATVIAAAALVRGVTRRSRVAEPPNTAARPSGPDDAPAGRRFATALARMCLVLLPEYLIIVLVIGAGRGWLLSLVEPAHHGVLLVVVAAVLGTLLVIPTAGEIPILTGLALAGVSSGVVGALLITLPAVSLPGAAMVSRSLGWRALAATSATVVVAGLAGGAALSVW
jgi:uncharacterized membrane protein YraQ (UPF0718 family)